MGEGDFSYSIQLSEESTDFVASCLAEINPHSPETMNNIRLLRERGKYLQHTKHVFHDSSNVLIS